MHDDTSKPFAHQHLHDKPNPSQIHRHYQALQGIPAELGESMGKANQTCTEWPLSSWFNTVEDRAILAVRVRPNEHLQLRFRHGSNGSQEQRRDATRLQRTKYVSKDG